MTMERYMALADFQELWTNRIKPTLPAAQVNADWDAVSGAAQILNKPSALPANGGNAATVNNHSVNSDVPSGAVFTDTTYSTMVASGSSHAGGLVPDPGSTAGTTKFLREDGTWVVPAYASKMSDVASISVVAITTNTSSSCSITGGSNDGKSQTIIYTNSTNADLTVTVPTTYVTPSGEAIELTCKAGGYSEVNYLNVNGTIYARGL